MVGLDAMNYLKGQQDYDIKKTLDGWEVSWREGEAVFVPNILIDEGISLPHLEKMCHGGRNIEHITRVTGYFSKVSGWNKGKVAELKNRVRTPI